MAGLFLLPIISSLAWLLFLHYNNIPLKQGRKGFMYILAISVLLILTLTALLWLTAYQHQAY
ncbi:hypothetical protein NFHSH190041_28400 [Shewanella sp. NFH-SH190041]|uniref:hypothetical protein n=1 Tax=Shewanella sp. NFH-SH190041 TaxID=2950245 RepID=UPI0021C37A65|nr:hypothetical protein [Shewanella sp. NFH-SH190041]BDM65388.1 hypothetical protein NFHSH190041_28400 [Shewanella sp. NFH-SH190041]